MVVQSYLDDEELASLGLASYGRNVKISRKTSIYGPENMVMGDNVRVDDFCILTGRIVLGNCVHIAAYSAIFGRNGVTMEDYSGISARVTIYSVSDDYSGQTMTNPTVPDQFKTEVGGEVILKKHSIVGAGCVILPSVTIGEGAAIGSMSLVAKNIEPWSLNVGIPAKRIKDREREVLSMEQAYLEWLRENNNQ